VRAARRLWLAPEGGWALSDWSAGLLRSDLQRLEVIAGQLGHFLHESFSAVHLEDLAELYCLALILKKARRGMILHAAAKNSSMKELSTTVHRGMGFKGEPSSLSLQEAKRFTLKTFELHGTSEDS